MTVELPALEVSESGGVLTLALHDPATRNSMSAEMAALLSAQLDRFEADPELRVLVVTGRDPAFCSGANVRRMAQANRGRDVPDPPGDDPWAELDRCAGEEEGGNGEAQEEMDEVRLLPLRLYRLRKPSIAAVNGPAVGLGMGVALGCDIRLASERATFSEGFVRVGLIPADGSSWHLPRIIGLGNTLLLQYTGEVISAEEALRLGIVARVTSHDDLSAAAGELAGRLAGGATYSMSLIKRLAQASVGMDLEESMRLAGRAQAISRRTADHREGVDSFIEKRRPRFRGR